MSRRRALISLLVVFLLSLCACKSQPADELALNRIQVDRALPKTVRSPADWRALYRLAPDRRFLLALGEIDRLASEDSPQTTSVRFTSGHWAISYAGKPVAPLPELPSYADLKGLLDRFARGYAAGLDQRWHQPLSADQWKEIEKESHAFLAPDAFKTLRSVDSLWHAGHHSPRLLVPAARALVYLSLQQREDAGVGDALPGEALATLTLAQAAAHDPMTAEEALLAYSLGYTNAARALASKLPEPDPVRTFLIEHRVRKSARAVTDHPYLARFLALRVAHEKEGFSGWQKNGGSDFGSTFTPAVLLTGVEFAPIGQRDALLESIPGMIKDQVQSAPALQARAILSAVVARVVRGLPRVSAALLGSTQGLVTRIGKRYPRVKNAVNDYLHWGPGVGDFEQLVARRSATARGPFLTPASLSAYFRGNYYAALYLLGSQYADYLDSGPETAQFARWLKTGRGGVGDELARVESLRAAATRGEVKPKALFDVMKELHELGPIPLEKLGAAINTSTAGDNPGRFRFPAEMAADVDSRVRARVALARVAWEVPADIRMWRRLMASAVRAAPSKYAWEASELASRDQDEQRLRQLASSDDMSFWQEVTALDYYADLPNADDSFIRSRFHSLIAGTANNELAVADFAKYLESKKDYDAAEKVLRDWLSSHEGEGLDRANVLTDLARILEEKGELDSAWEAIGGEALSSYMERALIRAAKIRFAQGERGEAEQIAIAAVRRYPDGKFALENLLTLLWKEGKNQQAARLIREASRRSGQLGWEAAGKAFRDAFKDRPDAEALDAFDAVNAQRFRPINLTYFGNEMGAARRWQVAFEIFRRIKGRGNDRAYELTKAYRFLKAWKGEKEARAWVIPRFQKVADPFTDMILYTDAQFDSVWALLPLPPVGKRGDGSWLMRVVAFMNDEKQDEARKRRLVEVFSRAGGTHDRVIGRYLLGIGSLDRVLKTMRGPGRTCEAAYYLGVKALADRDYEDASDWFHVALLTGSIHYGEYAWSNSMTSEFVKAKRSLKRLEADPKVTSATLIRASAPGIPSE